MIVCGDFNEEGESAVTELLTKGLVAPEYRCGELEQAPATLFTASRHADRCPSYPKVEITSKVKKQEVDVFVDAYPAAFGSASLPVPPSFVAPKLDAAFLLGGGEDGGGGEEGAAAGGVSLKPTPQLEEALAKAFSQLAGGQGVMDQECIDKWLTAINRQLGRGSE